MPYTILIFTSRRPDLSPDDYKSHYETKHVPLLQSIGGPVFPKSYTRRYVERSATQSTDGVHYPATAVLGPTEDFEYDCVTELVFVDEAAFNTFMGLAGQPDAAARIARDEEDFLDRAKTKAVVVADIAVTTTGPDAGDKP